MLVESAYRQESLAVLNAQIMRQDTRPVQAYIAKVHNIGWQVLPILVLSTGIVGAASHRFDALLLVCVLLVSVQVRVPGLLSRAIWDDEGITLLQTGGNNLPSWPLTPSRAGSMQWIYEGAAPWSYITHILRTTDVHPPIYFYGLSTWRNWFGFSIETARAFSVVCSVATVLALFLLLRAGQLDRPLIPVLVYSLSTAAVFWGSEARPYALAALFTTTGALLAYLAQAATSRTMARAAILSAGMAVCCGLAFQTNYLTLFPVGVILLWFLAHMWAKNRLLAVASPVMALVISLIGFSVLVSQLAARPNQGMGFQGLGSEFTYFFGLMLQVLFYPYVPRWAQMTRYAVGGAFLILACVTYVLVHWRACNHKLWTLLLGLAFVPSIGLFLLNVIFDKRIHEIQYVYFAAPALATIVSYPIMKLQAAHSRLGVVLLVAVLAVEVGGINWGTEEGPITEGNSRSLAAEVRASASPAKLVLIDGGLGRSNAASLVYELDPETLFLQFDRNSNLDELLTTIGAYDDLWMRFSHDYPPNDIRDRLLERLELSRCYAEVSYERWVLRLRKLESCGGTGQWPSRNRVRQDLRSLAG